MSGPAPASEPAPTPAPGRLAGLVHTLALLWGSPARERDLEPAALGRMWLWLGLAGLAWGWALAGLWRLADWLFNAFRYSSLPLMPVAAILAATLLGPFRRGLFAVVDMLGDESVAARSTVGAGVIAVLTLLLLSILPRDSAWSSWPWWIQWVRPSAVQRVLILMPAWGVWAMMTPVHFCRPAERADRLVRAFQRRQPVQATALWMVPPLAGTLWYLNFLGGWVVVPAVAGLLAGSLGGAALCWTRGGLSRRTLLAAAWLTQFAYLLGYLAAKGLLITWR